MPARHHSTAPCCGEQSPRGACAAAAVRRAAFGQGAGLPRLDCPALRCHARALRLRHPTPPGLSSTWQCCIPGFHTSHVPCLCCCDLLTDLMHPVDIHQRGGVLVSVTGGCVGGCQEHGGADGAACRRESPELGSGAVAAGVRLRWQPDGCVRQSSLALRRPDGRVAAVQRTVRASCMRCHGSR